MPDCFSIRFPPLPVICKIHASSLGPFLTTFFASRFNYFFPTASHKQDLCQLDAPFFNSIFQMPSRSVFPCCKIPIRSDFSRCKIPIRSVFEQRISFGGFNLKSRRLRPKAPCLFWKSSFFTGCPQAKKTCDLSRGKNRSANSAGPSVREKIVFHKQVAARMDSVGSRMGAPLPVLEQSLLVPDLLCSGRKSDPSRHPVCKCLPAIELGLGIRLDRCVVWILELRPGPLRRIILCDDRRHLVGPGLFDRSSSLDSDDDFFRGDFVRVSWSFHDWHGHDSSKKESFCQ